MDPAVGRDYGVEELEYRNNCGAVTSTFCLLRDLVWSGSCLAWKLWIAMAGFGLSGGGSCLPVNLQQRVGGDRYCTSEEQNPVAQTPPAFQIFVY